MNYELKVIETKSKTSKFHYQVINEAGKVISERRSNREYVAATVDGQFYFGRLDLIRKGDHGKAIRYAEGWRYNNKDKFVPNIAEPNVELLSKLNSIAYKK